MITMRHSAAHYPCSPTAGKYTLHVLADGKEVRAKEVTVK
jgi:hypothetical protein